jgi:hypothetical protein
MKSPRNLIIAVIFGFFLSFLTGLISGASFGILLLRALISGIVLGGVVFAVRLIADKFLLGNAQAVSEDASYSNEQGAKVDITLDDELFETDDEVNFAPAEPEPAQSDSFQPVSLANESAQLKKSAPAIDVEKFDPSVLAEAIRTMISKDG